MRLPLFPDLIAASTLAFAALVYTPHAVAQPAPTAAPSAKPDDTTRGMDSYAKGAELAKQQKWEEAYPHLKDAWDHLQHWRIALALGKVELELKKVYSAEKHLTFARNHIDLPETLQPQTDKLLAEAKKQLLPLEIVATSPIRARVLLDGETIGSTPYSFTIHHQAGDHQVELRIGRVHKAVSVTLAPNKKGTRVEITLNQDDMPDIPPEPSSQPIAPSSSAPATDTGALTNSPISGTVGAETSSPPSHLYRTLAIGAGGVAAIALGGGIAFWMAGVEADNAWRSRMTSFEVQHGKDSSYCKSDQRDPVCVRISKALFVQDLNETLAVTAWVASGVFAAGAATFGALHVRSGKEPANLPVSIVPIVTSQHAGIVVQGAF